MTLVTTSVWPVDFDECFLVFCRDLRLEPEKDYKMALVGQWCYTEQRNLELTHVNDRHLGGL